MIDFFNYIYIILISVQLIIKVKLPFLSIKIHEIYTNGNLCTISNKGV